MGTSSAYHHRPRRRPLARSRNRNREQEGREGRHCRHQVRQDHYAAAGTYKYEIRENAGSTVGLTYDAHVATAEVTVTENGDGSLTANVTKKENGRFTNTYRTELNYTAAGGLWLSKYLDGRPMTEGQFTFTVTPADDASARALGLLPGG